MGTVIRRMWSGDARTDSDVGVLAVAGAACHGFRNFSYTVMTPHFNDVQIVHVPCTM